METLSIVKTWIVWLLAALWLVGCGGSASMAPSSGGAMAKNAGRADYAPEAAAEFESDDMDGALAYAGEAPPAPPPPPAPAPPADPVQPQPKPPAEPDEKPKGIKPLLIYKAEYTMAVFETTKAIDLVQKMAVDLDGYLVQRSDEQITVRVPSETYRAALGKVSKLGDVLHRDETVKDVTDQFLDLTTRLRNHRAVRARFEQLLTQAKDVKEALAVERELARITGEIERIEGKLKYLRELIAFSTITVRFRAQPTETVDSNVKLPFPWLNRLGLSNLLNL